MIFLHSSDTFLPMSDNSYSIRQAEFKDSESITGLIRANSEQLVGRPLSDVIQNIDRFLVCEKDGELAGIVSWHILPEIGLPANPSVEIKSVAVEEAHRKCGVGHMLVSKALERIALLHPSQVIVLTFYPEFFRKLGFSEVPKEKLMHKLYTGCISCTRYDSPFTCPEIAMALKM